MQPQIPFLVPSATQVNSASPSSQGTLSRLDQPISEDTVRLSFSNVLAGGPLPQDDGVLPALTDQKTAADQTDTAAADEGALPVADSTEDIAAIDVKPKATDPSAVVGSPTVAKVEGVDISRGPYVSANQEPEHGSMNSLAKSDAMQQPNEAFPENKVDVTAPLTQEKSVDLWQTVVLPNEVTSIAVPKRIVPAPSTAQTPLSDDVPTPAISKVGPLRHPLPALTTTTATAIALGASGNVTEHAIPRAMESNLAQLQPSTGPTKTPTNRPLVAPPVAPEISVPLRQETTATAQFPTATQLAGTVVPSAPRNHANPVLGAKPNDLIRTGTRVDMVTKSDERPIIAGTKKVLPLTPWHANPTLTVDPLGIKELSSLDPLMGEARMVSATSPSGNSGIPSRVDLPSHIARQLAEVVQQQPNRTVEIMLKPQELGPVRLSLQHTDSGIVVNLIAERPETLDLMRRNIDQLGAEFQELGYTNIAFSFAGADTDAETQGQSDQSVSSEQSEMEETSAPLNTQIHLTQTTTSGVDLRL